MNQTIWSTESCDMHMKGSLLIFSRKGIYCPEGKFYIDPWQPVANAIITHGHADHSRPGHKSYLSHTDSVPIIRHRLGDVQISGIPYGKRKKINGVTVSLHPAGHILGSAQVRVEYKGEVWCASGDYKVGSDPVAVDFEPVKCHTFITECTFGLPVFNWPDEYRVIQEMEAWWKQNQTEGKVSMLSAYSLGKAQRVLASVDPRLGKIYCHGAVTGMNQVHKEIGVLKGDFPYLGENIGRKDLEGALVIAPPSAVGSAWVRKLGKVSVGMASGWMMLRGSKRRRNVDRGFVLSDHADWTGLNEAIKATGAENVICTHGYTDAFSRWLNDLGYNAYTENTLFEGESLESGTAE